MGAMFRHERPQKAAIVSSTSSIRGAWICRPDVDAEQILLLRRLCRSSAWSKASMCGWRSTASDKQRSARCTAQH